MPFAIRYDHPNAGPLYLMRDVTIGARRRVRFDRDVVNAERFATEADTRPMVASLRAYLARTTDDMAARPVTDPKLSVVAI